MNKRIALPVITAVIGVVAYYGFSALKKPPKEKETVIQETVVTTAPVTLGPMQMTVESYGVAEAKYETDLISQVGGKIVFVSDSFNRGQFVQKGELLATIEQDDYDSRLIEAEANLASAQAALELEKAQGKVARDEWEKINNQAPPELGLRKPQLAQEIARVKAAKAALKRAQSDLARTEIRAPYNAIINDRMISVGSVVNMGSALGQVLSTNNAEIRLPVSKKDLIYLEQSGVGAEVEFFVPEAKQERWLGTIVREEGVIDSQSRMTYLVAQINDPYSLENTVASPNATQKQPILRYGTYLNASIKGVTLSKAASLPHHLYNNGKVSVLGKDKTLEFRHVKVYRKQAQSLIITDGFADEDIIVTSPLSYPIEGMALKVLNEPTSQETATELSVAE